MHLSSQAAKDATVPPPDNGVTLFSQPQLAIFTLLLLMVDHSDEAIAFFEHRLAEAKQYIPFLEVQPVSPHTHGAEFFVTPFPLKQAKAVNVQMHGRPVEHERVVILLLYKPRG